MSVNALMQITQLPVIVDQLQTIKPIIEAKALELQAMECTDETLQAVKAMRAELRKDLADYEARRKEIKAAVTAPYEAFESVYKECISGPLKAADEAAAAKIAEVEGGLKSACEERLRALFNECRECYSIPWVQFEQVGIEITLALARQKTPKKAAVQIGEFFKAIRQDLAESAVYEYPRGGERVTGPSIRLAETVARYWGNLDYGITELDQRQGESTVMAYC